MGTGEPALSTPLLPSLRDGTFPTSDDLLTSEVSADTIPSILGTVSNAKRELGDEIRSICRDQGKDVDDWIVQAKKVQGDIARCKVVARDIVREHERVRTLNAGVEDAQAKVRLLQDEIAFSVRIQEEIEHVGALNRDLDAAQSSLSKGQLVQAAAQLQLLKAAISRGRSSRFKDILNTRGDALTSDAYGRLEATLDDMIEFGRDNDSSWLEIKSHGESSPTELDTVLEAFQKIGGLHKVTNQLTDKIEAFIIQPLLRLTSAKWASVTVQADRLSLSLRSERPSVLDVLESSEKAIRFLHGSLPELLRLPVASHLLPNLVSKLIHDWLIVSVPFDLEDIQNLQTLQLQTKKLANLLVSFQWPCHQELVDWADQAPHMWLKRRKMASLHGVRRALSSPRGPVRKVERVETEKISKDEADGTGNGSGPAIPENLSASSEDDEATGWGFDDAENEAEDVIDSGKEQTGEDDTEAAWGWDDEDNTESSTAHTKSSAKTATNGLRNDSPGEREVTLVETYTITDIPDYLLEIIGRDVLDAQTVKSPEYSALSSASPSEGLLALPNYVLAMFRATASIYYTSNLPSGNMHLYNDSMFIIQKLREASIKIDAIEADCPVMEKFGKSAYSREMDTQRTILGDLLDGAQGFVHCTQSPNSNECEIAVTSTVDRIRTIHAEWSSVLSQSALLQSIGSLMSSVIAKMIENIEDMDDISEPESKRLTSFCNQFSALEDIFLPQNNSAPGMPVAEEGAIALTALYVPNWLKFQFLINILDASLVDIKWLWTEGQMSLEFEGEEVVDLIKALFAESTHRRNAISAIRQHEGS